MLRADNAQNKSLTCYHLDSWYSILGRAADFSASMLWCTDSWKHYEWKFPAATFIINTSSSRWRTSSLCHCKYVEGIEGASKCMAERERCHSGWWQASNFLQLQFRKLSLLLIGADPTPPASRVTIAALPSLSNEREDDDTSSLKRSNTIQRRGWRHESGRHLRSRREGSSALRNLFIPWLVWALTVQASCQIKHCNC